VRVFDGTKSILLSTRTIMGGKNPFLGIAYVVVGGLCIVLGALFTATHLIKPRYVPRHACLQAAIQSRVWCSLLTSGGTMTENSATTAISAGTQSSPVGQLQPDAARDMVRERKPLSCMQYAFT
jgi:hypothetical protein